MSQKKGVPISIVLILIFTTFIGSWFIFFNRNNIKDFLSKQNTQIQTGLNEETTPNLYLGKEIETSGYLTDDGDLINFTHRLHNGEYGTLGLRSNKIDLYSYSGNIFIRGTIVKYINDLYIVNVDFISGNTKNLSSNKYNSGKFFSKIGILFSSGFLNKYNIEVQNDKIIITQTGNTGSLTINTMLCTDNPNYNCKQILETYKQMLAVAISNKDGITFYKNPESKLRFGSNLTFGYFIPDSQENQEIIKDFISMNHFVDDNFVENTLPENYYTKCKSGNTQLEFVENVKIYYQKPNYYIEANGKGKNGEKLSCKLKYIYPYKVDFLGMNFKQNSKTAQINSGKITTNNSDKNLENNTNDNEKSETNITGENNNLDNFMEKVKTTTQIPINLEKTYEFTSSRGYKIIFPSKNIYFAATGINNLFDKYLQNCLFQMNIVSYKEGENGLKNPDVIIYNCKNIQDNLPPYLRAIKTENNGIFIIYTKNPARYDFSQNIIIE